MAEMKSYPEKLNSDLKAILGRPCFACCGLANVLRKGGHSIPKKAEEEQAAVIHFLLGHYMRDPENWDMKAAVELRQMQSDERSVANG